MSQYIILPISLLVGTLVIAAIALVAYIYYKLEDRFGEGTVLLIVAYVAIATSLGYGLIYLIWLS